jgi:zinc transporter 2
MQHIANQNDMNNIAIIKLRNACICSVVFMIVEFTGGYFAESLALITDGIFLLSDIASYAMSLFAIYFGSLSASAKMPFGYHRAEVIGAIISVLLIWVLTVWLMLTAFRRLFQDAPLDPVDGKTIFFVSIFGLCMNVLLMYILGAGNAEADLETGYPKKAKKKSNEASSTWWWMNLGASENINVRAAYVHALGDFIQTLGVCLSGGLIWYNAEWQIADPITTILFSLPVLFTTHGIIKRSMMIIMEGAPEHVQVDIFQKKLEKLDSVQQVTKIYIWSVTQDRIAINVHLVHNGNSSQALKEAKNFLELEGFQWITIQVEDTADGL